MNNSTYKSHTFQLLKRNTNGFWSGFSELADLGNIQKHYNVSSSEGEADTRAIESDWRAVGDDLRFALKSYDK